MREAPLEPWVGGQLHVAGPPGDATGARAFAQRQEGGLRPDPGGVPYYRDFNQGSATPAANWVSVGGVLREVAGIVANGEAYFVGRNIHGSVWWYRLATSEWTRLTATVTAASPVH